ncbi:M56 family metallopeptidase, partial [Erysipelotrichaceae bacterium HCN-30851]
LNYFIKNTNKIKIFRTDFFTFLILITVLRLLLPIELFFTKSIYIGSIMNPIVEFFNYELTSNITILHISLFIWLFGSIVLSFRFIHELVISYKISNKMQKKSICYKVSDFLNNYDGKDYPIMISDVVKSPMVFGLKNIIFLPQIEFSEVDLYNIIHHEIRHIRNHDIFIKLFINLIAILYWWFPPVYMLSKNINLFLEIRVDEQVTRNMSTVSRLDYTQSLVAVQRKLNDQKNKNFAYSSFIDDSANILAYRIHYLIDGDFIKKTKSIFLVLLCVLPFLSNLIILEPEYDDSNLVKDTMTFDDISKGYIIQHKDGSYSLTINGQKANIGDSIPKDFANLPIIKEME